MSMYTNLVMDHFNNPRNAGTIPDADGVGYFTNPVCGDAMRLYLKVKDDTIEDARFQTVGCGAAIAASSMLTVMIKGISTEEAEKLTNQAIAEALGGLPSSKMHCSMLAADALHNALEDYRKRSAG